MWSPCTLIMGFEHKFLSVLKIYKDGDLVDLIWTQNYCQTWNNNIYVYDVKHVFHILPLSETQLENQLLRKMWGKKAHSGWSQFLDGHMVLIQVMNSEKPSGQKPQGLSIETTFITIVESGRWSLEQMSPLLLRLLRPLDHSCGSVNHD